MVSEVRGPKLPIVELNDSERQGLETLVRRHSTPQQVAQRGRIILAAADGFNNSQIALQLGLDVDTVRCWRNRWLGLRVARLEDPSAALRAGSEFGRAVAGCATPWGTRPNHPRAGLPDRGPGL